MNHLTPLRISTRSAGNLVSRSLSWDSFLVGILVLACFVLPPTARAVDPPPDGGYPRANTAEGDDALFNLTTGTDNTANGFEALFTNTIGSNNTATGSQALFSNTVDQFGKAGINNTANGSQTLFSNISGNGNTAVSSQALENNATGSRNTATGADALEENTAGNLNTANGYNALYYSTGSNNIGVGANAGVYLRTGSYNIDIGNAGIPSDAGKIRIGTQGVQTGTSIAGIYGIAVAGSPVVITSNGKLGVASSSARFKQAIKPMDKMSEAIFALKPVSFRYKEEIDPERSPQFGLVAEEVEKVNPDLVVRDEDGEVMTVRYEAVNAMLLNEFLKEHRKVEEQHATITRLESKVAKQALAALQQQQQIEALAATVQKVSNRPELNKSTPQVVASNE